MFVTFVYGLAFANGLFRQITKNEFFGEISLDKTT